MATTPATGSLARAPRTAERFFGWLGLVSLEGAWRASLHASRPWAIAERFRQGFERALTPYLASSWTARLAPTVFILLVALLLAASPYVGTGMNALLVIASFAGLVLSWLTNPPVERDESAIDLAFLATVVLSIVAVAFSPFLILSAKGFAKFAIFWMAFMVFRGALARRDTWAPVFMALFAAALVQSLYGIYQWKIGVAPLALWDDPETEVKLTRVYGTLKNPNLLGGYLVPIIPLAAGAALAWRGVPRLIAAATAILAPVCVFFTYSRGAYLALAAEAAVLGVLGLAWAWPRIRASRMLQALLAGFTALGSAGLVWFYLNSPALQARLLSMVQTREHSSNSYRMNVWLAVIEMIKDSWWAGIGLGNDCFRKVYALYMVSGFEALGAYNVFLEVAVETGIFGLLAFGWLLVAALGRALYHFVRGESRFWAMAAVAGLVGLMVHGLVDTVFYRPSVQILFWLLLAVVIHLPYAEGAHDSRR